MKFLDFETSFLKLDVLFDVLIPFKARLWVFVSLDSAMALAGIKGVPQPCVYHVHVFLVGHN